MSASRTSPETQVLIMMPCRGCDRAQRLMGRAPLRVPAQRSPDHLRTGAALHRDRECGSRIARGGVRRRVGFVFVRNSSPTRQMQATDLEIESDGAATVRQAAALVHSAASSMVGPAVPSDTPPGASLPQGPNPAAPCARTSQAWAHSRIAFQCAARRWPERGASDAGDVGDVGRACNLAGRSWSNAAGLLRRISYEG